ncbi:SWI/SNF-related matrix-associated actin-dependent regulator of chromatin subfamily A member 2/4 [Amycolatopsis saalfeldensis]|uniref:SWI/SNF-related matrix-associated actin-dependent regulator of chromatin subfamily A member 2/4 n=1 Tax=Amycolatopsis saalfeldensis TaxID=394193 RepID=A0A1H8UR33_9PSEU|nr:SWI/SNF-related matrix-associated actin-dependent regulator of chromatin subfamily A member 2/4 [Amycolatopsis saalfeldensis]
MSTPVRPGCPSGRMKPPRTPPSTWCAPPTSWTPAHRASRGASSEAGPASGEVAATRVGLAAGPVRPDTGTTPPLCPHSRVEIHRRGGLRPAPGRPRPRPGGRPRRGTRPLTAHTVHCGPKQAGPDRRRPGSADQATWPRQPHPPGTGQTAWPGQRPGPPGTDQATWIPATRSGPPWSGQCVRASVVPADMVDSTRPRQRGSSQRGPAAWSGPTRPRQRGPGQRGPGSAVRASAAPAARPRQRGPASAAPPARPRQRGSSQRGPGQRGPGQRGPGQRGPSQRGPSQRGPSQRGPSQRGPSQRGPGPGPGPGPGQCSPEPPVPGYSVAG